MRLTVGKKSPFGLKKSKHSSPLNLQAKESKSVHLQNDEAALTAREGARSKYDLEAVSLLMECKTPTNKNDNRNLFSFDFSPLSKTFPHHEELIRQFLLGFWIFWNRKKVTHTTVQSYQYAISEFIQFLNSDTPNATPVKCFADIGFGHAQGLNAWQLQHKRGRSNNRKIFAATKNMVLLVQANHSSHSRVGAIWTWPAGPSNNDLPSESYSETLFNNMVDACLTDIKFVKKEMSDFAMRMQKNGTVSARIEFQTTKEI
jgi:hypothetical protein